MRPTGDRGSATVLVLASVAVLCVVAAAGVVLGQAAVTRHRAEAAADLGALAAADRVLEGPVAGCARAAAVVRAGGAALTRCDWEAAVVSIEVEVRPPGVLGGLGRARARARAAPAGG